MSLKTGPHTIQTLDDLSLEGKSVFLRVDFNVPRADGKVADDTRIQAAIPTIKTLVRQKARVVLASHLGRPKGKPNEKYSLLPVAERLAELINREVILPDDCVGDGVKRLLATGNSDDVILLENLRFYAGEEGNDAGFAEKLKHGLDLYVSEAFGALHRKHASVYALPRMFAQRGVGGLVEAELKALVPLLEAPGHPYAVVLGGAKISDKIKVIETLLRKVDQLYIGGAMVFTFLKALGHSVGSSLVEDASLPQASRILKDAKERDVEIFLPKDFRLGPSIEDPGEGTLSQGLDIPDGQMGLDIGPETVAYYGENLATAKTIFWNGPLGLFEKAPFDQGTVGVARAIGESTARCVIGGGDSAAAVKRAGVAEKMAHVSTGGGATLEFLEGRGLPGLEALAV